MSGGDKWVRRFSVDETARHENGFTIYKITSLLFPLESPEAVTVVSVWKRYSEVQRLHRAMLALHAGLRLRGACALPKASYFRRFQKEVIEERAKAIKRFMEFIAEHHLLFISTEFVNFLQSGYPPPDGAGAITAIRAALRLPAEAAPPLERRDRRDHRDHRAERGGRHTAPQESQDETDFSAIPQIPIHEPANVEIRQVSRTTSFESITSLDSLSDDLYDELNKLTVERKAAVKKKTLPDLIIFDAPTCSSFEDYHTMPKNSDASSVNSTGTFDSGRSNSRVSLYSKRSVLSPSNAESKTKTEDSYVFEAGYLLNSAARCEDAADYQRAFEYYKSGIEKMLIGVQTDTDPQRRALIKEKTNKYLSYAEEIYKNHLCDVHESLVPSLGSPRPGPVPLSMLRRPHEELALFRVLAVVAGAVMLVLHKGEQACYAMKVLQKIPNNLTEFDEYFLQRTNETRQPILPTSIPYMVSLHAYIETNSFIFLILTYAPGEKLLDYIKNYVKSAPTTPARELNLENVFCEPLKKDCEVKVSDSDGNKENVRSEADVSDVVSGSVNNNVGDEFEELVKNSQRLLQKVDRVLKETPAAAEGGTESPAHFRSPSQLPSDIVLFPPPPAPRPPPALPPAAARGWGAQVLAAIESLHNAGVVCRDLRPANILLSAGGQATLTYFPGYEADVCRARLSRDSPDLYVAPELYGLGEVGAECDYWSYGAVMYELLCGVPLSHYHKSVFTSHTLLVLPEDLPVEADSLLTQLLTYDPAERLGHNGIDEIKNHPYFKHIDWQSVYDSWIVPG